MGGRSITMTYRNQEGVHGLPHDGNWYFPWEVVQILTPTLHNGEKGGLPLVQLYCRVGEVVIILKDCETSGNTWYWVKFNDLNALHLKIRFLQDSPRLTDFHVYHSDSTFLRCYGTDSQESSGHWLRDPEVQGSGHKRPMKWHKVPRDLIGGKSFRDGRGKRVSWKFWVEFMGDLTGRGTIKNK